MVKRTEQQEEQNTEIEQHDTTHVECITPQQLEELTNTLKRLQAEFENYKKRQEKENIQLIKNSNAILIKNILPVLDSFELALKENKTENPEIEKYRKGLEMIYTQLFSILKEQGLRIIETKDNKFDPYKHEVMLVKETDKEEDIILQEFQKGYMLNDIVLRHSKVMISKKGEKNE
ncbi:MAG: nucleotide exchange factor GrpE [Candidatus Woesearchaeota archaeon]